MWCSSLRKTCESHSVVSDCDPMDCSPPGSSVHGILQARILEWVAISSSWGSSRTRDQICVSCTGRRILYHLSPQGSPYVGWGNLKGAEGWLANPRRQHTAALMGQRAIHKQD